MTPLDAMKQALEALEEANPNLSPNGTADRLVNESITTLASTIAELESAEPVAWMIVTNNKNVPDRHDTWLTFDVAEFKNNSAPCLTVAEVTPLYSTSDIYSITTAIAELESAEHKKDAERYRELRRGQHWSVINGIGDVLRGDVLDAAIDEATK
jgi:beta-lactamase class A